VPSNVNPKTTKQLSGDYVEAQHGQPYAPRHRPPPATPNCQTGQNG